MMMRRRKKRSWWWWRLWWKLSKISGNDGGSLVEVFLPIHVNDYWVVDSCPRIKSLPLPKYSHDHRVIKTMRFLTFQCRLWESSLIPSVTMNTRFFTLKLISLILFSLKILLLLDPNPVFPLLPPPPLPPSGTCL